MDADDVPLMPPPLCSAVCHKCISATVPSAISCTIARGNHHNHRNRSRNQLVSKVTDPCLSIRSGAKGFLSFPFLCVLTLLVHPNIISMS